MEPKSESEAEYELESDSVNNPFFTNGLHACESVKVNMLKSIARSQQET